MKKVILLLSINYISLLIYKLLQSINDMLDISKEDNRKMIENTNSSVREY